MNKNKFLACLRELEISQADLARLLSITPRSISRWLENEGDNIPSPIQQVLNAWIRLKMRGLAWRPDQIPFDENWPAYADQIKRLTELSIVIENLLSKVEALGGPATQWKVNLNFSGGEATFGPLRLSFYRHQNGSFSPAIYGRSDQAPDISRDQTLLEDAMYCIAKAIAKQGWPK